MSIKNKSFKDQHKFPMDSFTWRIAMGKDAIGPGTALKPGYSLGYIPVPRVLLFHPGAPKGADLNLLLVILAHWNKEHGCFPGISTLSKETGLSERQVRRYIKKFEAKGILKIHKENGKVNYYLSIENDYNELLNYDDNYLKRKERDKAKVLQEEEELRLELEEMKRIEEDEWMANN